MDRFVNLMKEFPDFNVESLPTPFPEQLEDASWRGDLCPCFVYEAKGCEYFIYIGYEDEDPRFSVQQMTPVEGDISPSSSFIISSTIQTSDWQEVLKYLGLPL